MARLYSLDYVKSRAAFRKLIELDPDNPFGYLFEAGGIWWESSQEFGLFTSTPTLQGLFEQDVDEAQRKANAYIASKDPQTQADGYFVSGMALGTLGQWRLMKRHWMEAYFDGKKAVKHLKKCLKLDPTYYDAQLGLGVYDYQTAHLSGIAKLGFLVGVHGDEKRGLAEIQTAVDKARYANRQAAEFLLCIYLIDLHDYARALPVVQKLRVDFPVSPYYVFLEPCCATASATATARSLPPRELYMQFAAAPAAFRPKWLTLICGLAVDGNCLSKRRRARGRSRGSTTRWRAAKEKPDGFLSVLHLFRGQLLDVIGRRDEAVAEYKKTLAPARGGLHARAASQCLEAPCGRGEILSRLRALSKEEPKP